MTLCQQYYVNNIMLLQFSWLCQRASISIFHITVNKSKVQKIDLHSFSSFLKNRITIWFSSMKIENNFYQNKKKETLHKQIKKHVILFDTGQQTPFERKTKKILHFNQPKLITQIWVVNICKTYTVCNKERQSKHVKKNK